MRDATERADIFVWELVSVRCALARPVSDETRRALRSEERALVGALLDLGVPLTRPAPDGAMAQDAIAPNPPPAPAASQPLF